jgi:hypothetical protein
MSAQTFDEVLGSWRRGALLARSFNELDTACRHAARKTETGNRRAFMRWSKEVAKFIAGFAANQVLTHGAFALSGVQFTVFRMTYTPRLNMIAVVVWAVVTIVLVYYAWVKK